MTDNLERTDLAQQEFDNNLSRYERASAFLTQALENTPTPEQLDDHRRSIESQAWYGLMESVEGGWMTYEQAEKIFKHWFEQES